jgi:hypothetical protein
MARSLEQNPETKESFRFSWELRLKFDKECEDLLEISMNFPLIKFSNSVSKDKRKTLNSLLKSIAEQFEISSKFLTNSMSADSIRRKSPKEDNKENSPKVLFSSHSSPQQSNSNSNSARERDLKDDEKDEGSKPSSGGTFLLGETPPKNLTVSMSSSTTTSPSSLRKGLSRAQSSSDLRKGTLHDRSTFY